MPGQAACMGASSPGKSLLWVLVSTQFICICLHTFCIVPFKVCKVFLKLCGKIQIIPPPCPCSSSFMEKPLSLSSVHRSWTRLGVSWYQSDGYNWPHTSHIQRDNCLIKQLHIGETRSNRIQIFIPPHSDQFKDACYFHFSQRSRCKGADYWLVIVKKQECVCCVCVCVHARLLEVTIKSLWILMMWARSHGIWPFTRTRTHTHTRVKGPYLLSDQPVPISVWGRKQKAEVWLDGV